MNITIRSKYLYLRNNDSKANTVLRFKGKHVFIMVENCQPTFIGVSLVVTNISCREQVFVVLLFKASCVWIRLAGEHKSSQLPLFRKKIAKKSRRINKFVNSI